MPDVASLRPAIAALARGVLGAAYTPEVPEWVLEAIEQVPSEQDRRQLRRGLAVANSRSGALVLSGRPVPVSWLSPVEAESLLVRWKHSAIPARRDLASAIISLALLTLYSHPTREWERIGYAGPLDVPRDAPRRLTPLEIDSDTELTCDAVIVGSGAGGGCAAAGLAGAGLDVVVLEKGRYYSDSDFSHVEADALRGMYLYGGTLTSLDQSCRIFAGSALGGGTLVNFATSFRTPPGVLEEWYEVSGIEAFVSGEIDESLDEVSTRINVNRDSSAAGRRDSLLEEGLKKLGWHVEMMPRAVDGCSQDEVCGYDGFGCRVGAKQGTVKTYLEDAARHGARLITGADVGTVMIEDGRAVGVRARAGGHDVTVRARAVIVAGGAIETPALLLRSGLGGQVGRHLHLHPGIGAVGMFEEEVRIWEGTTQARYSNELRDWDGGYGPILETIPLHPGVIAAGLVPWVGAKEHRARMEGARYLSFAGALGRDRGAGRVMIGKDGRPRVHWSLRADDARRLTEALVQCGRVIEAAGAKEIFTMHTRPISYTPGIGRSHEQWAEEVRRVGLGPGKAAVGSWHQMGSARMGIDPTTSVVGAENECHEVAGLYVVDGSSFPTASGVNPMLSIYGIANRAAKKIAAHLS